MVVTADVDTRPVGPGQLDRRTKERITNPLAAAPGSDEEAGEEPHEPIVGDGRSMGSVPLGPEERVTLAESVSVAMPVLLGHSSSLGPIRPRPRGASAETKVTTEVIEGNKPVETARTPCWQGN